MIASRDDVDVDADQLAKRLAEPVVERPASAVAGAEQVDGPAAEGRRPAADAGPRVDMTGDERLLDADVGRLVGQTGDEQLVAAAQAQGPDGPLVAMLHRELLDIGVAALIQLVYDRQIFSRLKRLANIRLAPPLNYRSDEMVPLTYFAARKAVPKYIDRYILGDAWNPDRGSLMIVLVNACLLQFANEYNAAQRNSNSQVREIPVSNVQELEVASDWVKSPEYSVLANVEMEEILAQLGPEQQKIILRRLDGWTMSEIAAELGITARRADSYLAGAKRKLQSRLESRKSRLSAVEDSNCSDEEWLPLREWGIENLKEAQAALHAIDISRSLYESPRRPALYRPLAGDDRNQLDIILDGVDGGKIAPDRSKWVQNSARVCRDVFDRIQLEVPAFRRPGGRRKGSSEDLRELYLALVTVVPAHLVLQQLAANRWPRSLG